MRALSLSLILGFSLLLGGVSQAGVADGKLPHAGLFAFGTPQLLTLASR
mgnify:CR=1 FL=1|jgi:hypothetical protein